MRTVQEIYEHYKIIPSLQLHQLRVAAVAKTIADNSDDELDTRSVVLAGLFHDMGNIIKSDLTTFPDFLEPEGYAHWLLVKNEFISAYGPDEHAATRAIAREISLPHPVLEILAGVGFSKLKETVASNSFELKIAEYADLRVGPHGVIPMAARIEDGKRRYVGKHPDMPRGEEVLRTLVGAAYELEQQIFARADIGPDDITEQSIQPLIAELREYTLA